jgi:preprotein translocase subunit SecG
MDFISGSKNIGTSAFGSSSSSSSGNGSSSGSGGVFSNFFNLSIQKMVLILAVIAFVISVGTVAILLWKSKSTQKWPPEISKCPDRMSFNATNNTCEDTYGLGFTALPVNNDDCGKFTDINARAGFTGTGLTGVDGGYIPWEGIVDGKNSRASSLKCI